MELAAQDAAMPVDVQLEESAAKDAKEGEQPVLAGGDATDSSGIRLKEGQSPEQAIKKSIQSRAKTTEDQTRNEEAAKQKAAKQLAKLLKAQKERAMRAKHVRHEMKLQVVESRLREVRSFLVVLRRMGQVATPALPDIFVWLMSGEKRVAYARIPARDVLYSVFPSFVGKSCSTIQTLHLRVRLSAPPVYFGVFLLLNYSTSQCIP